MNANDTPEATDSAFLQKFLAHSRNGDGKISPHPVPSEPHWKNIPTQLKTIPQWVGWQYELHPGTNDGKRWTKVLYQSNGSRARSTDATTWTGFQQAQRAYASSQKTTNPFVGIGFVLKEGGGLIGLDFDHSLDPLTGRITDRVVAEYVAMLDSYTETSPSGEGLRILVFGELPPLDRKLGNIEMYSAGRFLTITGNRFPGAPATINVRQDQISAIHAYVFQEREAKREKVPSSTTNLPIAASDQHQLALARQSKSGAKFIALFDRGDWQDAGYPSQSEADLALCGMLRFWLGPDPDRIDTAFRRSALYSSKWDRNDYAARTIERALPGDVYAHNKVADAETKASPIERPRPLTAEIPEPREFPIEALGSLKGAVEDVHYQTQAPISMIANAALGVAALAVQPFADVILPTRLRSPLSLYLLTIADSGERKSTVDSLMLQAVREHEAELAIIYEQNLFEYQCNFAGWKKETELILRSKDFSDRESRRRALEELGPEPAAPWFPMRICGEPTLEGLYRAVADGWPTVGVFSDEGGQLIGGHAMHDENRLKTGAGLSDCWGGREIRRVRAGTGLQIYAGRRVSMHLMLQPLVARRLFADPTLRDQGLHSRFLTVMPAPSAGTRFSHPEQRRKDSQIHGFTANMAFILRRQLPIEQDKILLPRALPLSDAATRLWFKYTDSVEERLGKNAEYESIKGLANKLGEHAARLAAVMSLIDHFDEKEVSDSYLARGITLAEYYALEARRIYQSSQVSQFLAHIQLLLDWIRDEWQEPQDLISLVNIYRDYARTPFRDQENAQRAVDLLVKHHCLIPLPEPAKVNGHNHREVWRINR